MCVSITCTSINIDTRRYYPVYSPATPLSLWRPLSSALKRASRTAAHNMNLWRGECHFIAELSTISVAFMRSAFTIIYFGENVPSATFHSSYIFLYDKIFYSISSPFFSTSWEFCISMLETVSCFLIAVTNMMITKIPIRMLMTWMDKIKIVLIIMILTIIIIMIMITYNISIVNYKRIKY